MTMPSPLGTFKCDPFELRRIRPPEFIRSEKDGVTYLSANEYELAYQAMLEFREGERLPVRGKLWGELNRQVVIRDDQGIPVQLRGWIQGSIELFDASAHIIFRGTYYDVNLGVSLAGDEALTPTALHLEHWEHAFGEGQYLGHAFTMRVAMERAASGSLVGMAKGQID